MKWTKPWYQPIVHAAIGAAVALGISASAHWLWLPAFIAATVTAGFKEGSDAYAGRDSVAWAIIDALEIVAGAALCVAAARFL